MLDNESHSFKTDIWSFGLVLYELATNSENPYVKKSEKFSEIVYAKKLKEDNSPTILESAKRSPELCDFFNRW